MTYTDTAAAHVHALETGATLTARTIARPLEHAARGVAYDADGRAVRGVSATFHMPAWISPASDRPGSIVVTDYARRLLSTLAPAGGYVHLVELDGRAYAY